MLSSGLQLFDLFLGGKSWLTKRNAGTHRVRASRNQAENIVALRAKARVRRSNLIAIAVTKSVREISEIVPSRLRACYYSNLIFRDENVRPEVMSGYVKRQAFLGDPREIEISREDGFCLEDGAGDHVSIGRDDRAATA